MSDAETNTSNAGGDELAKAYDSGGVQRMFDLIEIELTRVRRMAEQTDDGFLLYLIDIAIIEANAKARSSKSSQETMISGPLERDNQIFALKSATDSHIVR